MSAKKEILTSNTQTLVTDTDMMFKYEILKNFGFNFHVCIFLQSSYNCIWIVICVVINLVLKLVVEFIQMNVGTASDFSCLAAANFNSFFEGQPILYNILIHVTYNHLFIFITMHSSADFHFHLHIPLHPSMMLEQIAPLTSITSRICRLHLSIITLIIHCLPL